MDTNEGKIKLDTNIEEWYDNYCPIQTRTNSGRNQIKPEINQSIKK